MPRQFYHWTQKRANFTIDVWLIFVFVIHFIPLFLRLTYACMFCQCSCGLFDIITNRNQFSICMTNIDLRSQICMRLNGFTTKLIGNKSAAVQWRFTIRYGLAHQNLGLPHLWQWCMANRLTNVVSTTYYIHLNCARRHAQCNNNNIADGGAGRAGCMASNKKIDYKIRWDKWHPFHSY